MGEDGFEQTKAYASRFIVCLLFLETMVLFGIGFVPDSVLDIIPNSITSLLAAMQFSSFQKFEDELAYASVFCTGNMRSCAELY